MATIQTFEEIEAWKRARKLSQELFTISQREVMRYDFALKDQLNRSTGSVMDNIAEALSAGAIGSLSNSFLLQRDLLVKPVRSYTEC